jgi:hypothetical protein
MTVDETQPVQPVQPVQPAHAPPPVWEEPVSAALVRPPAPARSGWVTTAAVVLLVVGALSALVGLIVLIVGLAFGPGVAEMMETQPGISSDVNFGAVSGVFTGLMIGIGIVALLWAAGHIAAGVGILSGRGWARITGIVLSVIGLLFSVLGVVSTIATLSATSELMRDPAFQETFGPTSDAMVGTSVVTSLLFTLPFVIGYVIALVALIRNGAYFDRPRTA